MIRCDPSYDNPESFAVTMYYKSAEKGESIQIVRIDNCHGYSHIDELYKGTDDRKPEVELNVWEAANYLENNWTIYARKHEENRDNI